MCFMCLIHSALNIGLNLTFCLLNAQCRKIGEESWGIKFDYTMHEEQRQLIILSKMSLLLF